MLMEDTHNQLVKVTISLLSVLNSETPYFVGLLISLLSDKTAVIHLSLIYLKEISHDRLLLPMQHC
jgi:hypothetical protein